MGTFIVIFPRGDRSRIGVADITNVEWERGDYALASMHDFGDAASAERYAKDLAAKHVRIYEGAPEGPLDAQP